MLFSDDAHVHALGRQAGGGSFCCEAGDGGQGGRKGWDTDHRATQDGPRQLAAAFASIGSGFLSFVLGTMHGLFCSGHRG